MDVSFLAGTPLFQGCPEEAIKALARQLLFRWARYQKGSVIFREGTAVSDLALVRSGSVQIEYNDFWGNRSILGVVEPGGVFAEAYACIPGEPMLVDAVAGEACEILFVSLDRLLDSGLVCESQNQVVRNLLKISARKNLQLSWRSLHTAPKTIRGRLMSYFSQQTAAQGSTSIRLPFDRQQLADYLNVDRSALSKELGKMKREGLLDYHKNVFELKGR